MSATHTPEPLAALQKLVSGLNATNWSSWQTTANFQPALQEAEAVIARERLNAAAPEMLTLLQELIDMEGPQPGTAAWGDKARALIAKATGEQA